MMRRGAALWVGLWLAAAPAFGQDKPAAASPADAEAPAEGEAPAAEGEEAAAAAPTEGAPGDVPAPAAEAKPQRPPSAPMLDDTSNARLEALEELVRRYEEETQAFRDEVRTIAERKYKERRRQIEESYAKQLAPVIEAERSYRLEAIASFERFLEKHPNDKLYTPDALFRLAELYFEKYDDERQVALKQFRADYDAWLDAGGEGDPPEEPQPHFERTIALYQRLITDFPNYRLLDGAYYLLGYTLRAQGETDEGMKAWQTLVNRYPNSRFYGEVWFRIGDYHFDEEQWPDAIAAFKKVVPLTDSNYYDKGLYKLAWTYYLVNEFDLGVTRFFELLDYSYAKRDAGELEGGSVLEEESITYVAISFSDDNWPRENKYKKLIAGDSFEDEFAEFDIDYVAHARDYFDTVEAKEGKKKFRREVFAKLGDILFKQSKNKQAVAALAHAIELDPLHRDAPGLQDLIVQAWEREREFDKASEARDALVKNYGENSEWAKKHIGDSEARKKAADLARISLYKAAIYYHQQAQKYFEDERQDLGVQFFKAAAQSYEEYLTLYPHDKEAYELSYYLADTYYYSLQFAKAADQYAVVRDSTLGKRYRDDAAINVMYSLEKVIDGEVEAGTLEVVDIFEKRELPEGVDPTTIQPQEIPEVRKKYIAAVDDVLARAPDAEKAPVFAYKVAALVNYYQHYDDANRRFIEIIEKYPGTEAAKFSANFILDYYLVRKDWVAAEKYAKQFKSTIKDDSGEFLALADKVIGGSRFQLAKKKLEDGDKALEEGRITEGIAMLEEGAQEYLKLLEEDPKREFADVMMYNAALSLEKARRPAKAAELYERLYKEYPDSPQAPEAQFRVASKSEQAFQFDKAISTYLDLVKRCGEPAQAPTPGCQKRRVDAQINAALALEGQQDYDRAANEFEKFAKLFPERPEAPEVFFRASVVQRKSGSTRNELASIDRFIKKYKNSPEQRPRIVEAEVRKGDIYSERADTAKKAKERRDARKDARAAYERAVSLQKQAKGSATATYYAAKASFFLAEEDFRDYEQMPIKANKAKKQAKELVDKTKRLTEVEKTYKAVITDYKQAEWSLASLYRVGGLYDKLQRDIFEAPCPKEIERIDPIACDEYLAALEDKAYAVEEKAVEAYRIAYERAQELKLKNEWTQKTLEALNLLRPAEFPIDKAPIVVPSRGDVYKLGLVLPNGGAAELEAVAPGSLGAQPSGKTEVGGEPPPPAGGEQPAAGGDAPPAGGDDK
jgi:TolA-binding protein